MGNHSGGGPVEQYKHLISDQVCELEKPSDTAIQKKIVQRIIGEFG